MVLPDPSETNQGWVQTTIDRYNPDSCYRPLESLISTQGEQQLTGHGAHALSTSRADKYLVCVELNQFHVSANRSLSRPQHFPYFGKPFFSIEFFSLVLSRQSCFYYPVNSTSRTTTPRDTTSDTVMALVRVFRSTLFKANRTDTLTVRRI